MSQAPTRSPTTPTQVVAPHLQISVAVGQTVSIPFTNVRNYSVSPEKIVDVRITPDGKSGLVAGRTPGAATLVLVFQDNSRITYDITVT